MRTRRPVTPGDGAPSGRVSPRRPAARWKLDTYVSFPGGRATGTLPSWLDARGRGLRILEMYRDGRNASVQFAGRSDRLSRRPVYHCQPAELFFLLFFIFIFFTSPFDEADSLSRVPRADNPVGTANRDRLG